MVNLNYKLLLTKNWLHLDSILLNLKEVVSFKICDIQFFKILIFELKDESLILKLLPSPLLKAISLFIILLKCRRVVLHYILGFNFHISIQHNVY